MSARRKSTSELRRNYALTVISAAHSRVHMQVQLPRIVFKGDDVKQNENK